MATTEDTQGRIVLAALQRYLAHGVKKTSMEDVAMEAGLTRVTIYRYFPDKKSLVASAFMHVVKVLERICEEMGNETAVNIESVLDRVNEEFARLPRGDLRLRLHELSRLHPDIWRAYQQQRTQALTTIFQCLLSEAERRGKLRPGLNREVMQAYFFSAVIDTIQDPALLGVSVPQQEIFSTLKEIFLHGILKE